MQDETLGLGRLFFTIVLRHVEQNIQSSPDTAIEELKQLEGKIEQWQTSDASEQLEKRFLLKELHIGCRSQKIPTWTGLVSASESIETGFENVQALCIGVSEYTELEKIRHAVADAKSFAQGVDDLGGSKSQLVANPVSKSDLEREFHKFVSKNRHRPPSPGCFGILRRSRDAGRKCNISIARKSQPENPEAAKVAGLVA